jgi:formylmethanofuran dehydrogenase subunit C
LNNELAGLADAYFSLDPEKIRINEITIEGDFECAGYEMRGGTLVVNGDVEYAGWFMKGGSLVVNGDVKDYAGHGMKGGTLVVNGDVERAGWMKGGRIAIYGKVDLIYGDGGGRIYIDFDKNPGYKMDERIRPIEEFDGGLND